MEPLTLVLIVFALFVMFLMLTSGSRKKRLEKALSGLETSRLKLMKSIEHVKLSFYQKKLDEKEAQDKIFELEEKLRGVESKILGIREKPLMRTLKKYEGSASAGAKESQEDVKAEEVETTNTERKLLENAGEKAVVLLFIIIIVVAMVLAGIFQPAPDESAPGAITKIELPMKVTPLPETGTFAGSTQGPGVKVQITNDQEIDLKNISLVVEVPAGSGLRFSEGEVDFKQIQILEKGGVREYFFPISVDLSTAEGEYVIVARAMSKEVESSASGKLIVTLGGFEQ